MRPVDLREAPLPGVIAERVVAIEREAFAKGYAEGERSGEAAATARTETMIRRLVATIDEIASLRTGMMRRTEREIVRLALAIAERVVHREVAIDQELLIAMARVAIDRLGDHVAATIHLNPADHEIATDGKEPFAPGSAVRLVADPQIPRGGCIVRSDFGVVDAGVDGQIRELSRALLGDDPGTDGGGEGEPNGLGRDD